MRKSTENLNEIMDRCPILYCMKNRSMQETCMCWGLEISDAWKIPVEALSNKLEALNMTYYPKYRTRIQMDQVKSKYGTLRAYFTVMIDPPLWLDIWHRPFYRAHDYLRRHVDYKFKTVVDKESYVEDRKEEIPNDKVEERKEYAKNISNVEVKQIDGKWYEICHLEHMAETHQEPTKHKALYLLQRLCWKLNCMLSVYTVGNDKQNVIASYMESLADEYVAKAEAECYDRCEVCGTQIGTDWSPRIETKGWVSYICEDCDKKQKEEAKKREEEYKREELKREKARLEIQTRALIDNAVAAINRAMSNNLSAEIDSDEEIQKAVKKNTDSIIAEFTEEFYAGLESKRFKERWEKIVESNKEKYKDYIEMFIEGKTTEHHDTRREVSKEDLSKAFSFTPEEKAQLLEQWCGLKRDESPYMQKLVDEILDTSEKMLDEASDGTIKVV